MFFGFSPNFRSFLLRRFPISKKSLNSYALIFSALDSFVAHFYLQSMHRFKNFFQRKIRSAQTDTVRVQKLETDAIRKKRTVKTSIPTISSTLFL
ncbi:MAG: hypothetical protein C0433_18500 [Cyclobacterium sp.]|nr:hypothetical protein [Cyclobacterium sp.]